MFLKPFRVKSNSQLKNTERKNLKSRLLKHFTSLSENDIDLIFSSKDTISVIKLITHTNNSVAIYTSKKRPMIFECDDYIYPTVYFLWNFPDLLPCFTTHPYVITRLSAGADLMLPGVVLPETNGPAKYGHFEKGTLVAVNVTSNKLPLAVGITAHSSMDMFMAAGRGKCVQILHVLCDYLYKFEGTSQVIIPDLGPPEWLKKSAEVETSELEQAVDVSKENISDDSIEQEIVRATTSETLADDFETKIDCNSTDEMDKLLIYCFLKAIKYSNKKLTYPILTSNFYRLHMITACPPGKNLDIKKTKHKKLNKFLTEMKNEGLVNLAEQTRGVETIISFNLDHPLIKYFVCDNDDVPEEILTDCKTANVDIVEKYVITATVTPIFSEVGLRKGDSVRMDDVRKHVTKYVKKHKLQSVENPDLVIPNKDLSVILKSQLPQTWSSVMQKVYNSMSNSYQISSTGTQVTSKCKIEPIIITISSRSGNKKVTLVDNLEVFGIRTTEFGKECQHGVATSTSVSKPPGKKYDQLLIQGNQVAFVGKLLLEKYKIPKKYIRGLELAVKNKPKN